jgi:hypothetical protein
MVKKNCFLNEVAYFSLNTQVAANKTILDV